MRINRGLSPIFHLPASEAQWRSDYAVIKDWGNPGSGYVSYTVPDGGGLNVWAGPAAGQTTQINRIPIEGVIQTGGASQIYIPDSRAIIKPQIPTPTGWW